MTPAQTATVRKIIAEHLGVELEKVVDEASLVHDLGADSLDGVELVLTFEEEFNLDIGDDSAFDETTVGDVIALLGRKLT